MRVLLRKACGRSQGLAEVNCAEVSRSPLTSIKTSAYNMYKLLRLSLSSHFSLSLLIRIEFTSTDTPRLTYCTSPLLSSLIKNLSACICRTRIWILRRNDFNRRIFTNHPDQPSLLHTAVDLALFHGPRSIHRSISRNPDSSSHVAALHLSDAGKHGICISTHLLSGGGTKR